MLHLFEVDAQQSGEIKCVATYGSEKTVCHTNLVIFPEYYEELPVNDTDDLDLTYSHEDSVEQEVDNICPAYIICGPQDCTALIGGQVVLEVIYGGHPEPAIKWLKAVSDCRSSVW